MKSNKQRREELRIRRERKAANAPNLDRERLLDDLESGRAIPVQSSMVVSWSVMPIVPRYYRDTPFVCRDCGKAEIWTAKQQQWWYEVAGGEIETKAIKCRRCRQLERERREEVRNAYEDGLRKKRQTKNA